MGHIFVLLFFFLGLKIRGQKWFLNLANGQKFLGFSKNFKNFDEKFEKIGQKSVNFLAAGHFLKIFWPQKMLNFRAFSGLWPKTHLFFILARKKSIPNIK